MTMQTIERDHYLKEIIDGEAIISPSPFGRHQRIVMKITRKGLTTSTGLAVCQEDNLVYTSVRRL
ncbi:MAG: hypothetical protein HQK99_05640 [Nitrospirae bacterium]|nr:hypothetical protein [Nitrospirota bacterium]